ncbi:proline transporter 2 [Striga asiatica]|uniref:Proline transporter 2 n=1 Tax=Striga asiatica TaxID=4170 RepID=A0A5A7RHP3_STRAF|nr:proline transporter 2 [Striga asiatica]
MYVGPQSRLLGAYPQKTCLLNIPVPIFADLHTITGAIYSPPGQTYDIRAHHWMIVTELDIDYSPPESIHELDDHHCRTSRPCFRPWIAGFDSVFIIIILTENRLSVETNCLHLNTTKFNLIDDRKRGKRGKPADSKSSRKYPFRA